MEDQTKNNGAAPGAAPASLEEALILISQLQGTNQEIAAALNDANSKISELQEQNLTLQTAVTVAQASIESLTDEKNELSEQSKSVICELKAQLQSAKDGQASASTVPVVEVDGVKYQVNHGALGIGSAKEIAADPEKAKKILAKDGQQALTKLS
jgi:hypothetical protein